jgi:hypothetical protein
MTGGTAQAERWRGRAPALAWLTFTLALGLLTAGPWLLVRAGRLGDEEAAFYAVSQAFPRPSAC